MLGSCAAALLSLTAAPAGAQVTGSARAAAAAERFAVPLPAHPVTVVTAECPDRPGQGVTCADPINGIVYMPEWGRFALAHELGHIYLEALDGDWKGLIMARLGFDPTGEPWDQGSGWECEDGKCPSEVAADAYAACALRLVPEHLVGRGKRRRWVGWWETAYGYMPSERRHRRVCRAIRASR